MKWVYVAFAIAGMVLPYLFFLDFFVAEGLAIDTFVAAGFVNGAAGGFTTDVLVSSACFWLWLANERARHVWAYVLANLLIGLSCALPAYLAVRAFAAERAAAR